MGSVRISNKAIRIPNQLGSLRHDTRSQLDQVGQMKFRRPCIDCGALGEPGESRCPTHTARIDQLNTARRNQVKANTQQYKGAYTRLAKIIRQTAVVCHICGDGPRYNDPWEADHLQPGTPVTDLSQLAPAHRSCNQSRGNRPL